MVFLFQNHLSFPIEHGDVSKYCILDFIVVKHYYLEKILNRRGLKCQIIGMRSQTSGYGFNSTQVSGVPLTLDAARATELGTRCFYAGRKAGDSWVDG